MYVFQDRTLLCAQLRFVAAISPQAPTGDRQVLREIALKFQSQRVELAVVNCLEPVRYLREFVQMEEASRHR